MDIMSPGLNIAGPQCPIVVNSGSTPTSLVWKGLTEFITIGQTQTFSRIAIRGCSLNISKNVFAIVFVFVFVVVFLLGQVMFSHHSDQIKCLKGQKSQRLLFEGIPLPLWVSNQGRPRAARAAKKSGYKTKLTTCTKNIFVVG